MFPPAMWALIAKPRRSVGNVSDSSALPTGCCGLAPMRATLIAPSSWPIDCDSPPTSRPSPNTIWPPASSAGRAM